MEFQYVAISVTASLFIANLIRDHLRDKDVRKDRDQLLKEERRRGDATVEAERRYSRELLQ